MRMFRRAFVILPVLLALPVTLALGGCAGGPDVMARLAGTPRSFDGFVVCHGYGCFQRSPARLSDQDRTALRALFPAADAAGERAAIANAIALIERSVGSQVGTEADRGRNMPLGGRGQQDCIDEAANTTSYLLMMAQEGLLRFHEVGRPAHRGLEIGRWPHNTAVILERGGGAPSAGESWAVDSWYEDNGLPPAIVPLALWRQGWAPDKGA